jgi:CRISPR-associated protein Cmr1
MPVYDFKLRLISPAFVAGTDKEHPEMRASTIRGHWRYWWRAFNGIKHPDTDELYKQESKVFGSTSEGSRFNLIVIGNRKVETHGLLPHREGSGNVPNAKALAEGSYALRITTRPNQELDESVWNAFKIWSLLGGMGRRSRRMFGAFSIQAEESIASKWYPKPENPQGLAKILRDVLQQPIKDKSTPNVPTFPTFSEKHSWVLVSTNGFETAKEANQEFFRKLLRTPKYRTSDQTFGSVQGGRRGSPVHAQVRKIGTEYYPVISAFWSKPDARMDEKLLADFMKEAQEFYKAEHVWGGW